MKRHLEREIQDCALSPERLKRDSHCIYLDTNDAGEKLSAGFYDRNCIKQGHFKKYDAYFAVTWLLQGKGLARDYLGRTFEIKPGDMLVRHAGTAYELTGCLDDAGRWLEFSTALPGSLYRALRAVSIIDGATTHLSPGMSAPLLETACEYLASLTDAERPEERTGAYARFLEFFDQARILSDRLCKKAASRDEIMVARAKKILSMRFDEHISIRETAARLGTGYENFRKIFLRLTGLPPNEYRIGKRLEKADSLLLQTRMPIKEIASFLGYSAVSVFTRQYASRRKQTPGAARSGKQ